MFLKTIMATRAVEMIAADLTVSQLLTIPNKSQGEKLMIMFMKLLPMQRK